MNRRAYLATLGSGALAALAGCSALGDLGERPCDGEGCDVGMTRNAFVPREYEATVGDAVVWKNTSSAQHTITAYENALPEGADYFATGGYDSEAAARDAWDRARGGIFPGETYEHTFEVPGTYPYVCLPHAPDMDGVVVVTE